MEYVTQRCFLVLKVYGVVSEGFVGSIMCYSCNYELVFFGCTVTYVVLMYGDL